MCKGKPGEIVERARKAGVRIMVNSGINPERIKKTLELIGSFGEVKASLGIYPVEMLKMNEKEIKEQLNVIRKNKEKIIAVGEIGMDLKEAQDAEQQKKNFRKLIKLAIELDKPIIVHSRKAEKECIDIIEEEGAKKVIMHCFSGNFKLVKRIIDNKWYMTIPTNITFSEHFQKVAKEVPIEQLFCETDSPFLHPAKGERDNEPANVVESYKKLAEIKGISLKECEEKIENNYKRLFGS
ncbi:MAG: TatD family hydrolase [Candidatus Pacearchaeota archaeon]